MTNKKLFIIFFFFVLIAGGLLQRVFIPLTQWSAGHGLLRGGDWCMFHSEAVSLANQMKVGGWSIWELRYKGNSPIGITAIFYFLTGIYEPWITLPLNAFLYGLAALVLFNLFKSLTTRRWVPYAAIAPLIFFPSTAMIWGQIHKDIWVLPGALLIISFWISVFINYKNPKKMAALFFSLFAGAFLIWVVRPYLNRTYFVGSCCGVLGTIFLKLIYQKEMSPKLMLMVVLGLVLQGAFLLPSDNLPVLLPSDYLVLDAGNLKAKQGVVWERSMFPTPIDNQLSKIALLRERFRFYYPDAGSNIDQDQGFSNVFQIVRYLPRALQISLFSPFPKMWISEGKNPGSRLMRLSAALEMCFCYISLLGWLAIPRLVLKKSGPPLFCSLICSLGVVIIYSLVICNVGTLYRMRYPIMLFWMGLGWLGWQERFSRAK